jgi:hypothetical protein
MKKSFPNARALFVVLAVAVLGFPVIGVLHAAPVSFSREVLPILSDNCFSCHGPDDSHRKAGLRLDLRDAAMESGAIVPGAPERSETMIRIRASDPDELMPPPDSHRKPLTRDQVAILDRWIREGAEWERHWAFEKPVKILAADVATYPVDAFVNRRLERERVEPTSRADRRTLLRRLSFDLIGLPPTPTEISEYLNDQQPGAWARQVDRLLASPHYGERMAMWWLDAGRYSDTDGYQQDSTRGNWPWRDWVVGAFNDNLGFDQFTIEQFAGDLLPDATPEQRLATCFHRNHMTNGEGGRDPEESRVDYVIDRVNTTGTVWLGLTLGCAQCHSHKFDPVSQKDYYRMFAYFNSIDEDGRAGGGAKPFMKYQSPLAGGAVAEAKQFEARAAAERDRIRAEAMRRFGPWLDERVEQARAGIQAWHPLRASRLHSVEGTHLSQDASGVVAASGPSPRQDDYHLRAPVSLSRVTGFRLEVFPHASHTDGKLSRGATGEFILTDIKVMTRGRGSSQVRDVEVVAAVADVERNVKGRKYGRVKDTLDDDPRNGWTTEGNDALAKRVAVFALAEPLVLAPGEELIFVMLHRSTVGDANIGRYRVSITDQPGEAVRSLKPMPMEDLAKGRSESAVDVPEKIRARLFEQFLTDDAEWLRVKATYDAALSQRKEFERAAGKLNVMTLAERGKPRDSHILVRGVWDAKGELVRPGVPPAVLSRPDGESQTRLDLARWLVSREHPLTARVTVNHIWQILFGAGLVRTPEDFGLQGEQPTHSELLDWLAVDLMENGWDVKRMIRTIVTSETYRRSSNIDPLMWERDPENRLLARASRHRLPSWMLRDAALRSSGLLNPALGGPPVRPYQPVGVWKEIFMGRFTYRPSVGAAQYRRTLYAFWRRSSAPTFLFDSSQRRVCEVRTRLTNTPLHALTLMNDTSLLEASRTLAERANRAAGEPRERVARMFEDVLSRPPVEKEARVLGREYHRALTHYAAFPKEAAAFVSRGQFHATAQERGVAELAAGMLTASLILNLDEAMNHE